MIISPQSFGDLLIAHAHAVVSLGLFRKDGVFFPMEDVGFSGLEAVFREKFFQMMLRREKLLPETVERFKSWEHSGFSVNWERKFAAEDRKGLEGLLAYMERPAVSLRRLHYRDDGLVHYRGTRAHPRRGLDHQLLTPVEFLALLVPQVLLRYEVTLRLYGALSTTWRKKLGWIQNPPVHQPPPEALPAAAIPLSRELSPPSSSQLPFLGTSAPRGPTAAPGPDHPEDSEFSRNRRRSWGKLIAKVFLENPELCRSCGKPMKIIAAIAPEPVQVIERILRHLALWDPPWKRPSQPRGPPPSARAGSTASPRPIDRRIDVELDLIDPIPRDDDPQA
ncbi:MAG: transposase [Planctomycetes bacterium]|nr:transposase [Planctomycetota bacterium]